MFKRYGGDKKKDDEKLKPAEEWHEDTDTGDINVVALAAQYIPGSEAERKFKRKIDRRIVPCIWGLYTLSYLDRANIGWVRWCL